MTRRILIMAGTFAVLLIAFWLYRHYWSINQEEAGRQRFVVETNAPTVPLNRITTAPSNPRGAVGSLREGAELRVEARNRETGSLESILRAPEWKRLDDGSYDMVHPSMEMHQRNGAVIYITGDRGRAYCEQTSRTPKINSGTLIGNVQVLMDRGIGQDPATLDKRPDDMVKILLDDVSYDNNQLMISTPNKVQVFSREADIVGSGLTILMNESPGELRVLRLERGQSMTIKTGAGFIDEIGSAKEVITEAAPPAAPDAGEAAMLVEAADPGKWIKEGEMLVTRQPTTSVSASQIASQPLNEKGKPARQNIYFASLVSPSEDIKIVSGDSSLSNAQRLQLCFEYGKEANARKGTPATGTKKSPTTDKADAKPTVITWNGPLELRPIGYTPTPDPKRYEVSARGEKLALVETQTTIHCREVYFRNPAKAGRLTGTQQEPVILTMADGERLQSPQIIFDNTQRRAYLTGPGLLSQPQVTKGTATQVASLPATQPAAPSTINWEKSMIAIFGQRKAAKGGVTKTRQFISEALFSGATRLEQPATGGFMDCKDHLYVKMAPNDLGKSEPIFASAVGKVDARFVDVSRSEDSRINADKTTVQFAVDPYSTKQGPQPTKFVASGHATFARNEKDGLTTTTAMADEITAYIARESADVVTRTAILTSTSAPANITQVAKTAGGSPASAPTKLTGANLHLENKTVRKEQEIMAWVNGKGAMEFPIKDKPTAQDAGTTPASAPAVASKETLVHVEWADSMTYNGPKKFAEFKGSVLMDHDLDHLTGQSMHVEFDQALASASQPARVPQPASGPASASGFAFNMEGFGTRRLSKVTIEKDVNVSSRKEDDQKNLVQWMELRSDNLVYDMKNKDMMVNGGGLLMSCDYHPPKPVATNPGDKSANGTDSLDDKGLATPSQTLFKWSKSMHVGPPKDADQLAGPAPLQILLDGEVFMDHHSGKLILVPEELKKEKLLPWGDMKDGQFMRLVCDTLLADFAAAQPAKTGTAATKPPDGIKADMFQAGIKPPGPLQKVQALGNAMLTADSRKAIGQRLIFEAPYLLNGVKKGNIVQVYGYPAGGKEQNAQIIFTDPRGAQQVQTGPEIIWNRDTNKIEARKSKVGGGIFSGK